MKPSEERPFCLEDYRPFLKSLADSEDESVLVGGLALNSVAVTASTGSTISQPRALAPARISRAVVASCARFTAAPTLGRQ